MINHVSYISQQKKMNSISHVRQIEGLTQIEVCHYWYFLNYSFKFQPNVCNKCDDLLMIPINLRDIATLNIKGFD